MNRVFIFLVLFGLVLCPKTVAAQTSSTDLSIDIVPNNPEPGTTVVLTAKSYGLDLSQTSITWTYDAKVIARGTGTTSISIIAPTSGTAGVITATATGAGIESASSSVILRPGSLDVLWEAVDAYTPPFYKGKALLPVNGLIRLSVIPSSTTPKNLSYSWSRNGSALSAQSGYNRSSLVLKHNEFNPQEMIELTASGGSFSGSSIIRLKPQTSLPLLAYQSKGGFIEYANGYNDTIAFTGPGMVLHFEPYYFSVVKNVLSDLAFDLQVDGETVTQDTPNEIGLSRPITAGQSILRMAVTPLSYSLQHATNTFNLLFN